MELLFFLLLILIPLGGIVLFFLSIKEWGNFLLRCTNCRRLGTLKKIDSPMFKRNNWPNDLLDAEDHEQDKYIYACRNCRHIIKI